MENQKKLSIVKNLYNFEYENKEIEEFIHNEGSKIYKENEFFKDLHNLMKIKEFSDFYKKYFTNWFEIEMMMMYMKLYTTIKESYELKYHKQISDELHLFMLREIIRNNDSRKIVLNNFELFKKGLLNEKYFTKFKKYKKLKIELNDQLLNENTDELKK